MNAISQEERVQDVRVSEMPQNNPPNIPEEIPGENLEEIPRETQNENPEESQVENQEEIDEDAEENQSNTEEEAVEEIPRITTRSGREVVRPSRYAAVTKVSHDEWRQELADKAIKKELSQLFEELVAIVPVKREDIPTNATILNSHMFLVNKYDANGVFEKVKARLVADGRDQDATLYPNKSSPTVSIHSVFTVLGMAGSKRWLVVAKIDIKGAFVQTPMTGPPIFMKISPKVVKYAKELYPELDEYRW
jgi:hypothetical protein